MDKEVRQRLQWIKLYEETGDADLVCRRCGITRPTLRKWWKRYQMQSIEGLKNQSRRPHSSPTTKIGPDLEELILELRGERNLEARRMQSELKRLHGVSLSVASIHKVLCRHQVKPLVQLAEVKTTNKNSLYDSYIRAFRWSSDKLKRNREGGIIGFITNGGWLDGNAAAGFRKCLISFSFYNTT